MLYRCRIWSLSLIVGSFAAPAVAVPPGAGWQKVFQDNFDATKVNANQWSKNYAQAPYLYLDHQASMSPDNVKESGGMLYLTATHAQNPAAPPSYNSGGRTIPLDYTSGAVNTKDKFSISGQSRDAYVEARMQLPSQIGSWPAFWLMPNNGGWPPEIDAMEMPMSSAATRKQVQYHYHYGSSGATEQSLGSVFKSNVDYSTGFHNFGVEWGGDHMSWYVDDKLIATVHDPSIEQMSDMYIILNLGVGGWAGTPPSSSVFPAKMRVDWVRAYRLSSGSSVTQSYLPQSIDSNDGTGSNPITGPHTNSFHGAGAIGGTSGSSAPTAVPEPASVSAILLASAGMALRRSRRR